MASTSCALPQWQSKRVLIWSIWINVVLSLLKVVIGLVGNSASVVSDGIHSFSDLFSDVLLIWGIDYSNAPPDKDHPYGHKKMENILSMFLAIFLIVLAVFFVVKGVNNILSIVKGQDLYEISPWVLLAAGISVLGKEWIYFRTIQVAKESDLISLKANAWHHRSDSLSSLAVFIGVGIAIWLGSSWIILDPIISILIAFLIAGTGYRIFIENIQTLLDKGLKEEEIGNVKKLIQSIESVKDIHAFRSRYYGNQLFLDFHIVVNPQMTIEDAYKLKKTIVSEIRKQFPNAVDVFINVEPN